MYVSSDGSSDDLVRLVGDVHPRRFRGASIRRPEFARQVRLDIGEALEEVAAAAHVPVAPHGAQEVLATCARQLRWGIARARLSVIASESVNE